MAKCRPPLTGAESAAEAGFRVGLRERPGERVDAVKSARPSDSPAYRAALARRMAEGGEPFDIDADRQKPWFRW